MIRFAQPLSKGWNRMKKSLFRPFDIKKWFVVGFTAFLAGLTDCAGHGGGQSKFSDNFDAYEFFHFPETVSDWLAANPFWAVLIMIGIALGLVLIIIFTWLGSRGKFMFLDNVIYDKAEVSKPWYEYTREGNSLFLWRLVFGIFVALFFIIFAIIGFNTAYNIYYEDYGSGISALFIIGGIILFLVTSIVLMYVDCFLDNFVVPIMYKNRISAIKGWSRFFKILFPNLGYFILFGLLKFVLILALGIGIFLAGLLTCCIGFIFLAMPYIGDVVLLPFSYTFRAFGVEFLEQFGDEFKLFFEWEAGSDNGEVIIE